MSRHTRGMARRRGLTFAQRQQLARIMAANIATRRCPDCGKLCRTYAGNPGTRDRCESCGG